MSEDKFAECRECFDDKSWDAIICDGCEYDTEESRAAFRLWLAEEPGYANYANGGIAQAREAMADDIPAPNEIEKYGGIVGHATNPSDEELAWFDAAYDCLCGAVDRP